LDALGALDPVRRIGGVMRIVVGGES